VTDEHERIVDDLAAYVLESLEGFARARVEAHVATCATCARRLEEYRAVVGALPMGLTPVAPPPAAWVAIRAGARERRPRAQWRARMVLLPTWRRVMWPVLTGLVASLLVWNVVLQRELARYSSGPQVEALARRPGRLVILTGTGTPGASGRLLVAVDGVHGHLAVAGLKPLPPERTYQLWFVRPDARPGTAGTFAVDERGRAWVAVAVPFPLDEARVIMVTEEPAPGGVAPTGSDLLNAPSWR
jgi:anti-sigma-K factor RskA